jgi:hypothetical protein
MNTQRIIKPLKNPEVFEDTKGVIRTRKRKRVDNTMTNIKKEDKQQSTKHYIQNYRSSNMNPAINRG